jgi:hypothetical protein
MEGKTVSTPFDVRNDLAEWHRPSPATVTIFGAAGDLTKRLIMPGGRRAR